MTDKKKPAENKPEEAEGKENANPLFINGQFIRDFSFEAPNSPAIFNEMKAAPEVEIGVDVQAARIEKNLYGVDLKFNVTGKINNKVAFLVELVYGCVCTLNVEERMVEPMLLIEIPRHLFPFARNIIADATREGGFPPLMITPIDFVALYRHRVEQAQKQAAANAEKDGKKEKKAKK